MRLEAVFPLLFLSVFSVPNPLLSLPRLLTPRTPESVLRTEFGTVLQASDFLLSYLEQLQPSLSEVFATSPPDPVLVDWAERTVASAEADLTRTVRLLDSLKSQAIDLSLADTLSAALTNTDSAIAGLNRARDSLAMAARGG